VVDAWSAGASRGLTCSGTGSARVGTASDFVSSTATADAALVEVITVQWFLIRR
jgi:hypothetical protein